MTFPKLRHSTARQKECVFIPTANIFHYIWIYYILLIISQIGILYSNHLRRVTR